MKRLIGILIFLMAALGVAAAIIYYLPQVTLLPNGANLEPKPAHSESFNQNGIKLWQDIIATYYLVLFEGDLGLYYQPKAELSLAEVLAATNSKLITNAGFYYSNKDSFTHSGLLLIKGEKKTALNTVATKQISHVVYWQSGSLAVASIEESKSNIAHWQTNNYSAFQTGPLLISSNKIQSNVITQADNYDTRSLRTVLGQLLDGTRFIWIQRSPITLPELAGSLNSHPTLQGKIDFAINLDGGGSTSFALRDTSRFNFLSTRQIPNLLFIK